MFQQVQDKCQKNERFKKFVSAVKPENLEELVVVLNALDIVQQWARNDGSLPLTREYAGGRRAEMESLLLALQTQSMDAGDRAAIPLLPQPTAAAHSVLGSGNFCNVSKISHGGESCRWPPSNPEPPPPPEATRAVYQMEAGERPASPIPSTGAACSGVG